MTSTGPSVTRLGRDECLRLLASEEVGRLAVVQGHIPAIVPVTYVLDGEAVVFRTDPGTKLDHGPRSLAAFEIDRLDRATRTGWSVVGTGRLEEVTRFDAPAWAHLQGLDLHPWAGGEKAHWMRLGLELLSGRRIGPPGGG